jgi:hypothetical protein
MVTSAFVLRNRPEAPQSSCPQQNIRSAQAVDPWTVYRGEMQVKYVQRCNSLDTTRLVHATYSGCPQMSSPSAGRCSVRIRHDLRRQSLLVLHRVRLETFYARINEGDRSKASKSELEPERREEGEIGAWPAKAGGTRSDSDAVTKSAWLTRLAR